jgi:flagellar motility protein MotE (MotC chaperone)
MSLHLPFPRLLPLTIAAMAALLVVKSTDLVRAAVPGMPPAAQAAAVVPAAKVAAAAGVVGLAPAPPASAPPAPPVSDSERGLLLDLRHRSAELDARAAALGEREAVLSAAEKQLAQRVVELTALQARLESLERARKARDEASWAGLVKLYEDMKPRDAATIFNDLDMQVLLPVLDRMKEMKAAPIMAAMQPTRARDVTAKLAQLRLRENAAPDAASGGTMAGGAKGGG